MNVIEAGKYLIKAKDKMAHGQWLPWLNEKFELTDRTASSYMRIARGEHKLDLSNPDLSLRSALEVLTEPRETKEAPPAEPREVRYIPVQVTTNEQPSRTFTLEKRSPEPDPNQKRVSDLPQEDDKAVQKSLFRKQVGSVCNRIDAMLDHDAISDRLFDIIEDIPKNVENSDGLTMISMLVDSLEKLSGRAVWYQEKMQEMLTQDLKTELWRKHLEKIEEDEEKEAD